MMHLGLIHLHVISVVSCLWVPLPHPVAHPLLVLLELREGDPVPLVQVELLQDGQESNDERTTNERRTAAGVIGG